VHGQNPKPTFQIISANQNQTDYFIQVAGKIKSLFEYHGFVVKDFQNLSAEQGKSDFNIVISIKNSKDSIDFVLEIFDNCWGTNIASSHLLVKSQDIDIKELSLVLCDEIFGTLTSYFEDMFKNGQIIKLTIKSSTNLNSDIKTTKGTMVLFNYIDEYIQSKSLDKPQITQQTEFDIIYKLKIPKFDNKNRSISGLSFGNELKKYFNSASNLKPQLTSISIFEIELGL